MKTFKKYFKAKLGQKNFREAYKEDCSICGTTATIIEKIYKQGMSLDEASDKTGVRIKTLKDLESGEKCDCEAVLRLCRLLDIEMNKECEKNK